jgi:hypothetical protein
MVGPAVGAPLRWGYIHGQFSMETRYFCAVSSWHLHWYGSGRRCLWVGLARRLQVYFMVWFWTKSGLSRLSTLMDNILDG